MSVRYKFKNDLQFNTLPCDGFDVSLRDLKKAVVRAKKFGRLTDFDLVVTNEQTSQVYHNDEDLIPKNSTLIIARHPLPSGQKKVWEEEKLVPSTASSLNSTTTTKATSASSAISGGAFKKHDTEAESATEDDKINAMMDESTKMYSSENWQNVRGRGRGSWGRGKIGGPPPPTYICVSCNQGGHWRNDCPIGGKGPGQEIKRTTGIPRSFLTPVPVGTPGAKMTPTGILMGIEMEKQAYETKKTEKPIWDSDETEVNLKSVSNGVEIPQDLICPVCKDLLKDAIMMPECGCPMCDECARDSLINSDKNECPDCGEANNSPDDLIPWRQLRDKVNNFKNESGYNKTNKQTDLLEKPNPVPLGVKPSLPDIYLPDPKDVNFDKVVSSGQVPSHADSNATADSPVYGMAGPSPSYSISPSQELASSGLDINNISHPNQDNVELDNDIRKSIDKDATSLAKNSVTPIESRSISRSKSRSPSKENTRIISESDSGASRAVSFPDTSQPPPVHPINSSNTPVEPTPNENLQGSISNHIVPESNKSPNHISGISGVASNGSLPPVIGPPPGTYAVRLPATVPSHLPPAAPIPPHDHPQPPLHVPLSVPHALPPGPVQPIPPYSHPPPRHLMPDIHDLRRGPPPGHGILPPHLPPRNMYGIDKDGYIDDPLAAFERAMAMKDASKGRIPPPRYADRGPRRRYYSPDRPHGYPSRSPPRYRDRRSPFHRRSQTPPQIRERRLSRSPLQHRPRSSKSPEDRGHPKGPQTPPHPYRESSTTPPESMCRNESPPPPPGTQSPESRRSPSRPNEQDKGDSNNVTSNTKEFITESKHNESARSPKPGSPRSNSREKDAKRRSSSLQRSPSERTRSPGPNYRRSSPKSDQYRYSPLRRHSPPPGAGYDYSSHSHEYYYRHERQAPPPPEDFYDHRRHGDYNHPPREMYGNHRDSGYIPRDRYSTNEPYYRNEYRERGRGYGYRGRGRGRGYNQYYPDRRNFYNEEHNSHHYSRSHHEYEGAREHLPPRSRSRDRSPNQRSRVQKSAGRESPSKDAVAKSTTESRRKEKSNSRDRTPSLTPEPEFRDQQEQDTVPEGQERKEHNPKPEQNSTELKTKDGNDIGKDRSEKAEHRTERRDTHGSRVNEKERRSTERYHPSNRPRSRSRSYEKRGDKRDYDRRDHRWESSRNRNRDQDFHRSRDRRDLETNYRDRQRQSPTRRDRNERRSEDRYHSSRRRDYESPNKESREDRQHRRNDDDRDRKSEKIEHSRKDTLIENTKDTDTKEKRKKEKRKKKKRDESADESDNSESGSERKKKKTKKDKKVKSSVKTTEDKSTNGVSLADDKVCDEDHVVLHNQETFEDCISNLENVLVKADKLTNNETEQGIDKGDNENKDDKDLREILKAKSSLNSASNTNVKSMPKEDKDMDYVSSKQHQNNEEEDSINLHVDSEYDEMVGSSDKEGKKSKRSEKYSDSGSDDKGAKKKKKKDKKEKKHKSKDGKKERKKSKKMLKELLGKDGLEELLSKLDGSHLPEDVLAQAVLSRTDRETSRSPSPFPLKSREKKDFDYRSTSDYSKNPAKDSSSRRAVISDGKSLKMTIDRRSPREDRPRSGRGDYIRRRSRDRSVEKSSRRRSRSPDRSRSPNRRSRSDHSNSKKDEATNSRLLEMSMNSNSRVNSDHNEPTKKLSIKDRLGPIRAPSGGRSTNIRKSPSRKDKWNSQDDKYNKRYQDNEISSESSPPPAKRSRDGSESKESTKYGNERSPSPSSRESNRKSLKDRKSSNKDFETEEDNDKTSNSGRSKRASSRKDKTNT